MPTHTTPSGLMDKDGLKAKAIDLLQASTADGNRRRLTLLELRGMAALRDGAGIDAAEIFVGRLGDKLAALSLDGDAAGQLTDTTYGIIHSDTVDPEAIVLAAAKAAEECAVSGVSAITATLVLDVADQPVSDAAHALAYILNAVANDSHGESVHIIATNLPPRLSQIVATMKAVHRIIEEHAFDIVYQPIVDLRTSQVHHFECLVRFKGSGDRSPYITIVFAEDTGLIGELDLEVLRRVIAVMRSPAAAATPALRFAVNLSGRSLADHRITGQVRRMLRDAPQLAGRLLLEITESAAIADLAAANAVVQEIRRMGFQVGLDDFGAGSAAFHYLRALKVDHVKIDGSYIRDSMRNAEDVAFVKSMVGLCTDLGIATIAEHVEDAGTAAMLKTMGVRYGQGWYFGKPLAPDREASAPRSTEWRHGQLYFTG